MSERGKKGLENKKSLHLEVHLKFTITSECEKHFGRELSRITYQLGQARQRRFGTKSRFGSWVLYIVTPTFKVVVSVDVAWYVYHILTLFWIILHYQAHLRTRTVVCLSRHLRLRVQRWKEKSENISVH